MGTAITGLILMALVGAVTFNLIKNKKKGKSSCGGNCAHCKAACQSGDLNQSGLISTVLEIDGMMCPMCESHVNDAIRNNFQVKSVKASHKTGICQITSQEKLDEDRLRKIIKDSGYELKSIHS
ncbi:MAG: FeoB-associated Cys-rich membrane protein [Treponema sp.]|nr:FeoB-associated Cys-rich membrane protein [Treponema sp.]